MKQMLSDTQYADNHSSKAQTLLQRLMENASKNEQRRHEEVL